MRPRMMKQEPTGQDASRPAAKGMRARGGVRRRLKEHLPGRRDRAGRHGHPQRVRGASAGRQLPGAVYTMTNSPSGNAIEAFARGANGSLAPAGTYLTGGNGGTLGSGHSIIVSPSGRTVIAVNAGSNSISEFAATPGRLRRIATVASGGTDPNSVTMYGDLVYVLNAGSSSIAGFRLDPHGLSPIPGSRRPLGAAAQLPRQIQFNRDGRVLVADEGGSSTIDTFLVARDGAAGAAITTPSAAVAHSGSTLIAPATCCYRTQRWSPARAAPPPMTWRATAP